MILNWRQQRTRKKTNNCCDHNTRAVHRKVLSKYNRKRDVENTYGKCKYELEADLPNTIDKHRKDSVPRHKECKDAHCERKREGDGNRGTYPDLIKGLRTDQHTYSYNCNGGPQADNF